MGLSIRCQGGAAALPRSSEIGDGSQGRSFSQPCGRTAACRRLLERYDPVQRIPVGRFPAPENSEEGRRSRFRQGTGKGAGLSEEQGGDLLAGLVRGGVGRLVASERQGYFGKRPIM